MLARELADDTDDDDDDSDSDEELTADDNSEDESTEDPELRDLLDNMDVYGGHSTGPTMHDGFVSSLFPGDQVVHVNQRPHDHRVYVVVQLKDANTCSLRALDDTTVQKDASVSELRRWRDPSIRLKHGLHNGHISKDIMSLNNAQRNDIDLRPMIDYLVKGKLPEGKDEQSKASAIIVMSKDFAIDHNQTLVRVVQPTNGRTKLEPIHQVVVPKVMVMRLLNEFHDSKLH